MIRYGRWLIALSIVAPTCLLAPSLGRAQAPGQSGFYNKSNFRDYDAFLFNYPSPGSPVTPALGGLSPMSPRLSPVTVPVSPRLGPVLPGPTPFLVPGGESRPGAEGRLLLGWVYQAESDAYRAVVMAADGRSYHWIYFARVKDHAYLYDTLRAAYIGIFEFPTRLYRPYEAATGRWGTATFPPVVPPSGPPIAPTQAQPAAPVPLRPSPLPDPGSRPAGSAAAPTIGAGSSRPGP